jgi:hypothetical protein
MRGTNPLINQFRDKVLKRQGGTRRSQVTCHKCLLATAQIWITNRRAVLTAEIPEGWTVVLVPNSSEVGLLLEYTCQDCKHAYPFLSHPDLNSPI